MRRTVTLLGFVVLALRLCIAPSASGDIIVDGSIHNLGSDVLTVDHWYFTAASAGTVTMDVLSWERSGSTDVDVNGDSEISYFDTYIRLFVDDGSLGAGDAIGASDDWGGVGDGSISGRDSYLLMSLGAGDYILAIGAFSLTIDEAVSGVDSNSVYPYGPNSSRIDHGDYRITFGGAVRDVTGPGSGREEEGAIPEPATLALLGTGLAAAALRLRRRGR